MRPPMEDAGAAGGGGGDEAAISISEVAGVVQIAACTRLGTPLT